MTHAEFASALAYLTAGCGKQLTDAATEVYWDCLGDLSVDAFRAAAKSVIMRHPWATFPSIAELREAAVEIQSGTGKQVTAQVAWSLACRAAGKIDPAIQGEYVVIRNGERKVYSSQTEYAFDGLPPEVVSTLRTFGIHRLMGNEPMGVLQAQFVQTYQGLISAAKRDAVLPAPLRQEIDRISERAKLPPTVAASLAKIGNPANFSGESA